MTALTSRFVRKPRISSTRWVRLATPIALVLFVQAAAALAQPCPSSLGSMLSGPALSGLTPSEVPGRSLPSVSGLNEVSVASVSVASVFGAPEVSDSISAGLDFDPTITFAPSTFARVPAAPAAAQFPFAAEPQGASDWSFVFAPYVWFHGIDGDLGIGGLDGALDEDFMDAVEDLEFAPAGRIEARNGGWAVLVEASYSEFDDRDSLKGSRLDVEGEFFISDFAVLFGLGQNQSFGLELLAGARYYHVDGDLRVRGGSRESGTEDWLDPIVGGRLRAPLGDGVEFTARGDVGGFDVSGSDSTWQAIGELIFSAGENTKIGVGYRHLDFEYDGGRGPNRFEFDGEIAGPTLSLVLRF